MNSSHHKFQTIFCILAGVGFFLPFIKISAYNESISASFMSIYDTSLGTLETISSKIVLGVLIAAFIMLLVRLTKDNFTMKIISLLLILVTGILYFIDVNKLSTGISLYSPMVKYGIGHYAAIVGLIATFVLGILDLFQNGNSSNRDIDELERIIDNYHTNNPQTNQPIYSNNNPVTNSQPVQNTNIPNNQVIEQQTTVASNPIKLDELVNSGNNVSVNNDNTNNIENQ